MKGQRGITLVALVITVIVMLILAGVAITALTADDNLLTRTNTAVQEYQSTANQQLNEVNNLLNLLNNYVPQN